MPLYKLAAIILIGLGTLGLIYGGFDYTKETHEAELGPLSLVVDEKSYVTVPIWAGIAGIVIGAALLLLPKRS
jgi:hypothetical protein